MKYILILKLLMLDGEARVALDAYRNKETCEHYLAVLQKKNHLPNGLLSCTKEEVIFP